MASQDLKQKDKLYGGFMSTLKWVIPLIAIIVFLVVALIAGYASQIRGQSSREDCCSDRT